MIDRAVEDLVGRALGEDVGLRDVTTEALVEPGRRAQARIVRKQPGMVYGLEVAQAVFRRLDALIQWRVLEQEGQWRKDAPANVVELEGDARALLSGERVALNFLGHLSGVATLTASCAYALRGTGVEILDTRKTIPGLRLLEKRAVKAGGGRNHRMGLDDMMLVKENHIAIAGGVGAATRRAIERRPPGCPVEVECRTPDEVGEAIQAGADRILLDNMSPSDLRRSVEVAAGRAKLEASGGVTLGTLQEVAATGIQFISLGALTHSAPALDLSMTLDAL